MTARHTLTILAVADPERASAFYGRAFGWTLTVHTPVYHELALPGGMRLGLYQRDGYARNTASPAAPVPPDHVGPAEIYLHCDALDDVVSQAIEAGARLLSARALRTWGEEVAYLADPDGHVLALAAQPGPAT